MMRRRRVLGAAALLAAPPWPLHALERRALAFPRDFGAHPEARLEWWYVTGALEAGSRLWGFQLTFFRSRTEVPQAHPSRFAATQLVFAHAALSDVSERRLRHDQGVARAGFGIAEAREGDTDVRLRDWSLRREDGDTYRARLRSDAAGYALDLALAADAPPSCRLIPIQSQPTASGASSASLHSWSSQAVPRTACSALPSASVPRAASCGRL